MEAMRELEEIFRTELPLRREASISSHADIQALITKFDRAALGTASPSIAEAARSLSESIHALIDTTDNK